MVDSKATKGKYLIDTIKRCVSLYMSVPVYNLIFSSTTSFGVC